MILQNVILLLTPTPCYVQPNIRFIEKDGEDLSKLIKQFVEHPSDSRQEKVLVDNPKYTAVKILILKWRSESLNK